MALKPIARGEEVFISYTHELQAYTRGERRAFLFVNWHFSCACTCCVADASSRAISDARRQILGIVWPFAEAESTETDDEVAMELLSKAYKRMRPGALARWQARHSEAFESAKSTFYFLSAALLESEGLLVHPMTSSWRLAARLLIDQIAGRKDGIVLVGSVRIALEWRHKVLQLDLVRRDHSPSRCEEARQKYDARTASVFEMRLIQGFVSHKSAPPMVIGLETLRDC